MSALSFRDARACVLERVRAAMPAPAIEAVCLTAAAGRVLAQEVRADRDYPATSRSVRDGFALRAADVPGVLRVIGEVRAGERFTGEVGPGQAVEIMTGAPVPRGADAVVMIEHVVLEGANLHVERPAKAGDFINPQGSEARAGDVVMESGARLDYSHVALLATVGVSRVSVFAKPVVAILATGDEIVEPSQTPLDYQIRNSNVYSLAAQVERSGGIPDILAVARDTLDDTKRGIERGLEADLLLLSGGVSAGKYDLVEPVLADLGAEFFFDRVKIQPGQPLVFGRARGKFFFGLPGNPASTMVTYEIFARAAVELLGGQIEPSLPLSWARLTRDFRHKPGLTRFLPAHLSGGELTPVRWSGSGDIPALARANAYLAADPDREEYKAGEWIEVLAK